MTKRIRNELTFAVPTSSGRWLQVAVSVTADPGLSSTYLKQCLQHWQAPQAVDSYQPAPRNPTRMH